MTDQEHELSPVTEGPAYPPILDSIVLGVFLVVSVAYAWSLRDIDNPEMNLLLLKPLFAGIWALLILLVIRDVIPRLRGQISLAGLTVGPNSSWREKFAPGTELGGSLVVGATFFFSIFGPGDGPIVYLASLYLYLLLTGYVMGDRRPIKLMVQSALCAIGLYLVMGVALGVHL